MSNGDIKQATFVYLTEKKARDITEMLVKTCFCSEEGRN